ncbi:DNA-binding protein [Desulfopila sp. IMCC35006]|uniref:DNA-binding protein n=1 Tax=Desulfopila sp. IMCC35006 TaxID=2569542 RepID=UPI0010ACF3DE|nr:DNA-binding protein [Desulfopila sp. IMCC35006]TKB27502.1 DNA-binding protein [Desulfopila sp. IMCC35006]
MKNLMILLAVMATIGLFSGDGALAQKKMMGKGGGGWGPGTSYGRLYNPQTVETIRGAVVSVNQITPMQGMNGGVHVVVKTDKETISVHLGPAWYIENQEVHIAPNDKIEVKGSRIDFAGKPAIIAAEVTMADKVLTLRDASGIPVWSGWRRR